MPTAWLAKVRLVGERLTAGAVPVPVRLTLCGLPVALSVTVRAALRVPLAAGVKVTLIVQLAPAATRTTAIIGLRKVAGVSARHRDAGEGQGRIAGVVQGDGLSRTRRADGLVAKSQAGGGKTGYRRGAGAGAGEGDGLGTSAGVVRDGYEAVQLRSRRA